MCSMSHNVAYSGDRKIKLFRNGKVAQQAKALVAKSNNLGSILGPTWWKKRADSHMLSVDLHMHGPPTYMHTYTQSHVK